MTFRRAFVVSGALALVAAVSAPSYAQEKKKLSKDEKSQSDAIRKIVDAVSAGKRPAPADVKLTFHNFFIKAGEFVYVPYVLDVEPGILTSFPAVMYVRAVAKNPAAPAEKPAQAKVAGNARATADPFGDATVADDGTPAIVAVTITYAFEDVSFVAPAADNTIQRALHLVPGDYDLYIALSEKPSKDKKAPAPKAVVFKQPLTVPNLAAGLATSTIILAKSLEPGGKKLSGDEQLEQPFTISGYKIAPAVPASFPKAGEMLWVYYIYNAGAVAATGKPDLNVEYSFFRGSEAKPFTRMPPSQYNATNLPPEFNLAAGHQVFVGKGVPLATFAPGDYKIEIKITDKTNSQSVTSTLPFTVTP